VKAHSMKVVGLAVALLASTASGCGEVARNGRSPVMAIVESLEAMSGGTDGVMGGTLNSDVIVVVERDEQDGGDYFTVFNDTAEVSIRLQLKDPGVPGVSAAPSPLNDVTFTRYRVEYQRADGRNTPGVDVPYPFDSAMTFTACGCGSTASAGFTIVRHTAKNEAPLAALADSSVVISTIAKVTFYGQDLAGNDVIATGNIGVFFGNFGD
jgi:hypothetical protein